MLRPRGPLFKLSPIACRDLKRGLSCLGFLALDINTKRRQHEDLRV
ncbi:unnamed protein product [Arabidopsis halleri]